MHDVLALREFYGSPLGLMCERFVGAALAPVWGPITGERLLGFGYALPWLDRFASDAERAMAMMPAQQGAARWPPLRPSATALVSETALPLADNAMDRILMVHALEHARDPHEVLEEMWRVLVPEGRLVIVVPNRRGVWARIDTTPFGAGRPYSRSQLSAILKATSFVPTAWSDALFFAPSRRALNARLAPVAERTGRRFWPLFAGAIVVEATKRIHRGVPVAHRLPRRAAVPVLAPQGASRWGASRWGASRTDLRRCEDLRGANEAAKPRPTEGDTP